MSKSYRLLFLLLALLLVAVFVPSDRSVQAAVSDEVDIDLVSQLGGSVWAVEVEGDYAYVGQGGCLVILDVSDPSSPQAVGKVGGLPGYIYDIDICGTCVYLVGYSGGLEIVDVSTPESPVLLGSCSVEEPSRHVFVKDHYAYVLGSSGLYIIDVGNAENPTLISSCILDADLSGIAFQGDYAYIAAGSSGLQVVDISDPSNPFLAGSCGTGSSSGRFAGICLDENLAYVSSCGTGWVVIDISNPIHPTIVSIQENGFCYSQAVLVGERIYWLNGNYGLRALDISDPFVPIVDSASSIEVGRDSRDFCISEGYAYVALRDLGLYIVDLNADSGPAVISVYAPLMNPYQVKVKGDYAYVIDLIDSSLYVVDISNPSEPIIVNTLDTNSAIADIDIEGEYAYLAVGETGLIIVNIGDPTLPLVEVTYDTGGTAQQIDVSGNLAYIANDYDLLIVDVSNPQHPVDVASYDFVPSLLMGVYVHDEYVFAIDQTSVRVLDCSDPNAIQETSSYELPNGIDAICFEQGYLYAVGQSSGLRIIDMRDPTKPVQIAWDRCADGLDICIQDSHAYIAGCNGTLLIIDVRDPANPASVGSFATGGGATNLAVSEEYVYLPADNAGFCILRCGGGSLVPTPTPGPVVAWVDLPFVMGRPEIPGDEYVNNLSVGAFDVYVANDLAYVAAGSSGLEIWDVSEPSAAYRVGLAGIFSSSSIVSRLDAKRVDVANGYAYLACGRDGLAVVDVRTPSNPVVASVWDSPNEVYDVDVVGNYAYVADGTGGLRIVDVSNASSPVEVATTWNEYGLTIKRVYVAEGYAYLACQYYWLVADVTNPTAPTEAGYWQATNSLDVAGYGDFCYFADGNQLWTVLGAHTGYPARLVSCELPGTARGVYSDGEYAYVAVDGPGLVVVDVTNPLNPFIAASYSNFYGAVYDTFAADGYVYFPSDVNGLYILN